MSASRAAPFFGSGSVQHPTSEAASRELVSARRRNDLMGLSTLTIVFGCIAAATSIVYADHAVQVLRLPAPILGVALALAIFIEGRAGLRNLVRVDLFMLAVLYLLTFLEFLVPLPDLTGRVSMDGAQTAVLATLLGFAGIAIGRHAYPAKLPLARVLRVRVTPRATILLFTGSAFLGHLYMLVAVNFDIAELVYQAGRPRFSQPWSRGRLGGFNTLLNEVGLLKFLLPPLGASILVQWRKYNLLFLCFALVVLSFVFYEAFAAGTRNVFLTHLSTFTVAYALLIQRLTLVRLMAIIAPMGFVAWFAIYYLPEIRTVGLQNFDLENARTETLFVDLNLVNVANLTQVFPDLAPFLGLEVPVTAVIRPIPRALWPGKPEGLSITIEQALGVDSLTLSATFIGELWMAGGYLAVVIAALSFGAIAGRWNRVGASADSTMRLILFTAGFFPAGICMRSFLGVVPTVLPLVALILFIRVWVPSRIRARRT